MSKSFDLELLEAVHRKLQEWWDVCVMKHHQSFLLVTAADAVSSCLSARLSQFEGDEEGHWDYSCHTAHSSRVQSSVLINCEWGQTDTHYLSIENALWLQKGTPLQHSLLPQWALYWSGQELIWGQGPQWPEYHIRQVENSQKSEQLKSNTFK